VNDVAQAHEAALDEARDDLVVFDHQDAVIAGTTPNVLHVRSFRTF
jgi:hypothetical protein